MICGHRLLCARTKRWRRYRLPHMTLLGPRRGRTDGRASVRARPASLAQGPPPAERAHACLPQNPNPNPNPNAESAQNPEDACPCEIVRSTQRAPSPPYTPPNPHPSPPPPCEARPIQIPAHSRRARSCPPPPAHRRPSASNFPPHTVRHRRPSRGAPSHVARRLLVRPWPAARPRVPIRPPSPSVRQTSARVRGVLQHTGLLMQTRDAGCADGAMATCLFPCSPGRMSRSACRAPRPQRPLVLLASA